MFSVDFEDTKGRGKGRVSNMNNSSSNTDKLERRTISEAVATLVAALSSSDGPYVDLITRGPSTATLSPRLELGIYRIAQESLRNVELHAEASHVTVELLFDGEAITLIVEDDGCGFDPTAIPQGH